MPISAFHLLLLQRFDEGDKILRFTYWRYFWDQVSSRLHAKRLAGGCRKLVFNMKALLLCERKSASIEAAAKAMSYHQSTVPTVTLFHSHGGTPSSLNYHQL
jgi:hypothetical protein